ncbi:hypothetical protein Dimus_033987, partial [Dionaea muscipula]
LLAPTLHPTAQPFPDLHPRAPEEGRTFLPPAAHQRTVFQPHIAATCATCPSLVFTEPQPRNCPDLP